jgi:16S rRNA (guanine(966)-N(2))-methyltransferase RsmD
MRIVGGEYRGRMFNPGKNFKARPTTDFAKEGLFNVLSNIVDFEEAKILDLFSGTGSISYEFLSRGCKDLTLIELNFQHIQFIKSVMKELKGVAKVYRADVFKFLESEKTQYDLIFADPPYDLPRLAELPEAIIRRNLIKPGGMIVIEHPKSINFSNLPHFSEVRNYGSVHFSFFKGF